MWIVSGSLLPGSFSSLIFPVSIQKQEWHERALFHHIHAIDSGMKYLFMKSKNMYSPLTLDSGNIDFWSTSPPPEPGPPVSQLWWLKGMSASLFKCLPGPNFSTQTLFIRFGAEKMKIVNIIVLTFTQNWSQEWHVVWGIHGIVRIRMSCTCKEFSLRFLILSSLKVLLSFFVTDPVSTDCGNIWVGTGSLCFHWCLHSSQRHLQINLYLYNCVSCWQTIADLVSFLLSYYYFAFFM